MKIMTILQGKEEWQKKGNAYYFTLSKREVLFNLLHLQGNKAINALPLTSLRTVASSRGHERLFECSAQKRFGALEIGFRGCLRHLQSLSDL